MIHIKIDAPVIPAGAGFKHKSTSWQVSKTRDFNGDLLVDVKDDEVNLLEYHVLKKIDPDSVVFSRVKIKFDDGKETEWSRIITLSENQKGFKLSNTLVVTPEVKINFNNLDTPVKGLSLSTNEFNLYAGVGQHKSTTWTIKNILGIKKWERTEDEDNLLSIDIPDDLLSVNEVYVATATHNTDTNSQSNPGSITFITGLINTVSL